MEHPLYSERKRNLIHEADTKICFIGKISAKIEFNDKIYWISPDHFVY